MGACKVCNKADCDDDCEELQHIARERQREVNLDCMPDPGCCEVCNGTLITQADLAIGVCAWCQAVDDRGF